MTDYQIQHQEEESLFYVVLEDEQRAYLKYRRSGVESAVVQIDIWSTFVPESYRGKGLLHITSSCWYASKLLERRQSV